MITLLTLSLFCLVAVPILFVAMTLLSIPMIIIMGILPWVLRLSAVILLLRALIEKPFHAESLIPAAIAFGLSILLS